MGFQKFLRRLRATLGRDLVSTKKNNNSSPRGSQKFWIDLNQSMDLYLHSKKLDVIRTFWGGARPSGSGNLRIPRCNFLYKIRWIWSILTRFRGRFSLHQPGRTTCRGRNHVMSVSFERYRSIVYVRTDRSGPEPLRVELCIFSPKTPPS